MTAVRMSHRAPRAGGRPQILAVVRWPVGGIKTYLRQMLRSDSFSDASFTIVLPDAASSRELADERYAPEVTWRFTENKTSSLMLALARASRAERFDVIHSHGFTSCVASAWAALGVRTPHLLTAHDVFTEGQFKGARGRIVRTLLGQSINRMDLIHCVTHDAAQNLLSYLPSLAQVDSRIEVIAHGVETGPLMDAQAKDLRQLLSVPADTVLFGFLGRFMAQKGFRILADAAAILAARLPDPASFRVVCVGAGGFVREDRQMLIERGLDRLFCFLPPERNVGPTIKGMDAIVMPSLWEASGLLAMEALVCGTPLIASRCIGLRETVQGTPARVVAPGDPVELAEAMHSEYRQSSRAVTQQFVEAALARFDAQCAMHALRMAMTRLTPESRGVAARA